MELPSVLRTALVLLLALLLVAAPRAGAAPTAEAEPANAAAKPADNTPLLRLTFALIKKRPDISYDQFYDYWLKKHGPLVTKWVLKYNIPTYTQIHTRPDLKKKLAPQATLPYDGIVEFELHDWAQWERAQRDPYVANVIVPDTFNFIDQSPTGVATTNATATLGKIKTLVRDGKEVKNP